MSDEPPDPSPDPGDDLLPTGQQADPEDLAILEAAHARRQQRFWHREARLARGVVRAAEHRDLTDAQLMSRHMVGQAKTELLGNDSFVPVFLLAVVIVIITPLIDESKIGRTIAIAMVVGTLLLALQRSLVHRRNLIRMSWIMGATLVIALLAGLLDRKGDPTPALEALVSASFVFVIAIALPAILIRTLLHPTVNLNTLAGVMTAYLFIGLMFTGVFRFINDVDSDQFFAQKSTVEAGDFEYFSFITITTTGYGDLTPGSQPARTAAMAEAITGQVFLVTVVARVVGLLGQQRAPRLPIVEDHLAAARRAEGTDDPEDDDDDDAGSGPGPDR